MCPSVPPEGIQWHMNRANGASAHRPWRKDMASTNASTRGPAMFEMSLQIGHYACVRLRALFVAYGVPTILLVVGMARILAKRDSEPAVVLLAAVALTSPMWLFVALRIDESIDDRPELLDAVDFHLTMLTGYLVG